MYNTKIFEAAISICGYILSRIHKGDSNFVREAEGTIPIVKKVTINGCRKTITHNKKVRWNSMGLCYSRWSNKRFRQYDIPIRTVYEDLQRKETEDVCR